MSVNLLVIGNSGNGKSSTCNSILGKSVFKTSATVQASTGDVQTATNKNYDQQITVVEYPGIGVINLDDPNDVKLGLDRAREAVECCQDGYHAVIILLKYGCRYTQQERDAIAMIKDIFGPKVLSNNGILIFSCGDNYDVDVMGTSFKDWCRQQTGAIAELFKECCYRCVLFNNRTKDDKTMKEQLNILMGYIGQGNVETYTLRDYDNAKAGRRRLRVLYKRQKLEGESMGVLGEFKTELEKINVHTDPQMAKTSLEVLQKKLQSHKQYLEKEAEGTDVAKNLLVEVNVREMAINTKIEIANAIIQRMSQKSRAGKKSKKNSCFPNLFK